MVNAWSLLYEELNGTMNKTYPIKTNIMSDETRVTPQESDEYDPIITVGLNTASEGYVNFDLTDEVNNISIDTSNLVDFHLPENGYYDAPFNQNFLADNDDAVAHHFPTAVDPATAVKHGELPPPGIKDPSTRKYKEDESIEALKNYISTTYGGHYTSDNNNVQTLDLIESVGDAESFCRSNAIKYLSRYDKKGQAKRDILKALHYSLLLYHFSGQLNETPTRGYETF